MYFCRWNPPIFCLVGLFLALGRLVRAELVVEDRVEPRLPQRELKFPGSAVAPLGTGDRRWEAAGAQWLLQQEPAEAFRAFRMAKKVDGRSAFAWWGLGFARRGEKLMAAPAFQEARRLAPDCGLFSAWAEDGEGKTADGEFAILARESFVPGNLAKMPLEAVSRLVRDFPQPGLWEWAAGHGGWMPPQRLFLLEGAWRMRWREVSRNYQRLPGDIPALNRLGRTLGPLWAALPPEEGNARKLAVARSRASLPDFLGKALLSVAFGPVKDHFGLEAVKIEGCPSLENCGPLGWKPPLVGPLVVKLAQTAAGEPEPGLPPAWTLVNIYLDGSCPRCLAQMTLLADSMAGFEPVHTQIICVGADSSEQLPKTKPVPGRWSAFPFALMADPARKAARELGCHDPYTELPLHGTFVCDDLHRLRWWRTGELPFENFADLQVEIRRLRENPPDSTRKLDP